jgi:hypothetical protein
MRHRLTRALAIALALAASPLLVVAAQTSLPSRISDADFWKLTQDLSEPNGSFRSDNLLSNEMVFSRVLPELLSKAKPEGVYMGVGPEQNFTYITAIKPKIAFIVDIRRGNLHLQLMYKALFELSADRAEFVSRLFTKPRPAGLTTRLSARELMTAYWDVPTSDEATYNANLKAILDVLRVKHHIPLDEEDVAGITYVYHSFYWFGPSITYSSSSAPASVQIRGTTYADLMMQADQMNDATLSYLGTEEKFAFLKDLESRNLVVPIVGNFGGPKAIRAVGTYLREHGAVVTAFYLSNVEQYLTQDGIWNKFCQNVATLPLDEASVFIRPNGLGGGVFFNGPASGTYSVQFVNPSGTTQLDAATLQRLQEEIQRIQAQRQAQAAATPPPTISPQMRVEAGNLGGRTSTPSIQNEIKACTGSAPER